MTKFHSKNNLKYNIFEFKDFLNDLEKVVSAFLIYTCEASIFVLENLIK